MFRMSRWEMLLFDRIVDSILDEGVFVWVILRGMQGWQIISIIHVNCWIVVGVGLISECVVELRVLLV